MGDGPRWLPAAVDAHRRAVAPRAARARDTVVAGCGIGARVAGDGVTMAGARPKLALCGDGAASRRVGENTVHAREARGIPILHSKVVRSAFPGAAILCRPAAGVKCRQQSSTRIDLARVRTLIVSSG